MASKVRPAGVKAVVGLEIIAGLITLALGLYQLVQVLLQPANLGLAWLFFLPWSIMMLVVAIVFASVFFILAYGLWKGGNWARKIALVLSVLGLVFSVFFGLAGGWYSGPFLRASPNLWDYMAFTATSSALIMNIPMVFFLTRKDVKEYFQR